MLNKRFGLSWLVVAAFGASADQTLAHWVQFADETATRLVAAPNVGANDVEEKDYAWGDVDRDGDIDLVAVRKEPFTTPGRRTNVLFLNENGVLVDRTADYATASDVPGDQGFLTPTNDRDVVVTDVNGDSWLDIVTAVTLSDGQPRHIGHPRVYINLGEDGGGNWLGFRYERDRIPQMPSATGQLGFNPRFCAVAAGDLTGDDRPELWFGDYDAGLLAEAPGADFDDHLLINNGNGFFTDETATRFSGTISTPSGPYPFRVSSFGAAGAVADMNGDGFMDIVKQTSLNNPLYVGVAYNDPAAPGFFDTYSMLYAQSPYFVSVGDLNQDDRQDVVITDDGADRYLLNQGNAPNGLPSFTSSVFSFDAASDDGFGSQSFVADLNNDGWNDVLVTDVNVDISGCSRRLHIYRNLGGQIGGNVVLQEQTSGTGCGVSQGNPSTCLVAGIPADRLEGVHNVAVFDINGDGFKDLVVGRCTGTQVYINQPPLGLTFSFPDGLPSFIPPGEPYDFRFQVNGFGGVEHSPGTARMSYSVDGGSFIQTVPTHLGNGLYLASLPNASCAQGLRFFFSAQATNGSTFTDPQSAPAETFEAVVARGTVTSLADGIEGDVSAWTIANDPSLQSGGWQQAVPVGAITGAGRLSAPDADAQNEESNVKAFVTENGQPGGAAGVADVDEGPTDLLSPVLDLAGTDGVISYSRWFFSDGVNGDDSLTVWVTGDGTNWTLVETITGANSSWEVGSFKVGSYVTPTATVRVRFRTSDSPNNDIVEAGIDVFRVERLVCDAEAGAGRVPDGGAVPGPPLTLARAGNGDLTLSWSASCSASAVDFEVYEGTLGDFTSHTAELCSTGGATTATIAPAAGNSYYLVVPTNGVDEGSYGTDSTGDERPRATGACLPQSVTPCQ